MGSFFSLCSGQKAELLHLRQWIYLDKWDLPWSTLVQVLQDITLTNQVMEVGQKKRCDRRTHGFFWCQVYVVVFARCDKNTTATKVETMRLRRGSTSREGDLGTSWETCSMVSQI